MSKLLDQIGGILERLWSGLKPMSEERRLKEKEVNQAIERVVDQVDPRIRGLMGYHRQLFPAVERALDYSKEFAQRLPDPVQVNRKNWNVDPVVNSLFDSMDKLRMDRMNIVREGEGEEGMGLRGGALARPA